ncbi:hypothetical protein B7H23_01280 [Notoacmeibacter marinus]|uniref:Uncharacterized protein n=1 Tax=Notoacmeibacter marinus TaxID=1876515 RepID=A0A231V0D2_9HYPH|nr:hypothetical protein B7H23_01280 [Notoacmeibacter marinus]
MLDISNLPVTGGVIVGALVYGAISLSATGPLVGERLIEKTGWQQQCQARLIRELERNQTPPDFVPKLDCSSVFGLFGREGRQLCQTYGNFELPLFDQLNAHQQQLAEANRKRLENSAAKTSSRCACAEAFVLEKRRTDFALHAGSLRLIEPAPVTALDHELNTALHTPACALKE